MHRGSPSCSNLTIIISRLIIPKNDAQQAVSTSDQLELVYTDENILSSFTSSDILKSSNFPRAMVKYQNEKPKIDCFH